MPADRFNEAEMYLVQNWQKACLVEKSMKEIRKRYAAILDRVWEAVEHEHKELDWCEIVVTQSWCTGYMYIGRNDWRVVDDYTYIGVENLRLEILADDNAEAPFIGIWAGKPRRPAMKMEGIKAVMSAVKRILPKAEFSWEVQADPSDYEWLLWYYLPKTRQELLGMILDGDGQRFVNCLVEHFEVFTKFIPVLDGVFSKPNKK
jgi:hypothetical protein